MSLRSCSACHRHVRDGATTCPFCAAPFVPSPSALPGAAPLVRRARAAFLVGSLSAGVLGLAACEKESGPPPQVAPQPTADPIPPQAPPQPAPTATTPPTASATTPPVTPPTATAVSMYGAPPPPMKK